MKGKKFYLILGTLCVLILYFGINIFLKVYFNRFTYITPDLSGKTIKEAEVIAKKGNLKLIDMGGDFSKYSKGRIYTQLPKPGRIIKRSRSLKLWISKGEDKVTLPDLSKYSLETAKVKLEELGLPIKDIVYTEKDNHSFHQVITSTPSAGSSIYKNQEVSLLINTKTAGSSIRVPDLIGLEPREAKRIIASKKLIIGQILYVSNSDLPKDVVIDMSINPGKKVPVGSVVDITINQ